MKVKVLEIDAHKLNKDSDYIIVLDKNEYTFKDMHDFKNELAKVTGAKCLILSAYNPETALKIYEIPKKESK